MIICKLADIMAANKERNLSDLARRTGLNRATVKSLFNDNFNKIDRNTIDALCKEYNVTPGLLLEYVPDGGTEREKLPCANLTATESN